MDFKKPEFILVLFVTFIVAAYVEVAYGGFGGSAYLALVFFIIALILLAKLKVAEQARLKASRKFLLIGSFIIICDIFYYSLKTSGKFDFSSFGTLDTMVLFLGLSMITLNIRERSIRSLGEFGIYFSSIFLVLFLIIYIIPHRFGSDIYNYYGYYATTIPSVHILQSLGFSMRLESLTTFYAYGVEPIYYKIDLGCFGFYSMLLIMSTVLAYRITSPTKNSHGLLKIAAILVLASYMANLLRILILVSVGYYYGLSTMLVFHTFLGWALFAVIVLPVTYFYLK
jgi:archaeosortase C (PEF-CTERM variant)